MFRKKLVKALTRSAIAVSLLMFIGGCQYFRPGGSHYNAGGQHAHSNSGPSHDHGGLSNYAVINHPHFLLEKSAPTEIALGQTFEYVYLFTPRVDGKDAMVEEMIPEGTSYVSSSPEAVVSGNKVVWNMPAVHAGECIELRLSVKAEETGTHSSCAIAMLTPVACTSTCVGEPMLVITKECSNEPCLVGDAVAFDIFVKNTGDFPAKDVVITDIIPEGMTHASGKRELRLELGTLHAGESRTSHIHLVACERGEHCNVARVTSSNSGTKEAQACCGAVKPGLAIEKMGTREQIIGKDAEYKVKVSNVGDTDLQDILVTDTIPSTTQLVYAPGADVNGRDLNWHIDALKPGESRMFDVTVKGCSIGEYCNEAAAALCDGELLVRDSASTIWKGYPAMCASLIDTCDPLLICEETDYVLEISNTGTAPDQNIRVVLQFSEQMEPLDADGPTEHRISGQVVEFAPLSTLSPDHTVVYRVRGKAASKGDARIKASITADMLESPLIEEESTQVY